MAWFEVKSYLVTTTDREHELVVDLVKKTCSCRKWDLTRISCYHVCACIAVKNDPWEMHVHICYSKDNYLKILISFYNYLNVLRGYLKVLISYHFVKQLYNCTLKLIVPLTPNVKISIGRPNKKKEQE